MTIRIGVDYTDDGKDDEKNTTQNTLLSADDVMLHSEDELQISVHELNELTCEYGTTISTEQIKNAIQRWRTQSK
jgi:hypothetical protein